MATSKRKLALKVGSYDADAGVFTATIATENPVRRWLPGEGYVREILDMRGADTSRVGSGMPFLDHHRAVGFDSRFGTVEAVRVSGSTMEADIRLLMDERTAVFRRALEEGHRIGLSIGFEVESYDEDATQSPPVFRATAWRLLEASVANVQADHGAHTRSHDMPPELLEQDETERREAPAVDPARTATRQQEAERISGIRSYGARTNADAEFIAEHIAEGTSVRDFRIALTEQRIERQERSGPFPHGTSRMRGDDTLDNPEVFRREAPIAMDAMWRGQRAEGVAAEVFAQGERAFAERLCRMNGIATTGMSDRDVVRRALTTSDFAIIAAGLANLTMRREYAEIPNEIADLFGTSFVPDFNAKTHAQIDWTVMRIGPKGEHGEYKRTYIDESGETIRVYTLGGMIGLTRELSINAAGRIGDMGTHLGRALAADENMRQVEFIEANDFAGPTLSDGVTVFHSTRGNIETLPAEREDGPDAGPRYGEVASALWLARAKAGQRKAKGKVMIGAAPTEWLVHPFYEETALKIVAAVTASEVGKANPLAGKLTVRSEPRLTDPKKSWLVVKPTRMDGAVKVSLLGHEAPFADARQDWETDNIEYKIRHDFGLGWLDWRSWTRLDHG